MGVDDQVWPYFLDHAAFDAHEAQDYVIGGRPVSGRGDEGGCALRLESGKALEVEDVEDDAGSPIRRPHDQFVSARSHCLGRSKRSHLNRR